MKIYISGKITGLPIKEAELEFAAIAAKLLAAGHEPINPMAIIPYNPEWQYWDYMAEAVRILLQCEDCFMLANWRDSPGAKIEHAIAAERNMPIFYQQNHNFF